MNRKLVDEIAAAVLYEGYILYPYRPSVKNRHRFTFGGVYPPAYSAAQAGADACTIQTECLITGGADAKLAVRVRFLHPIARLVKELSRPVARWPNDDLPPAQLVQALRVGALVYTTWQEATERTIDLGELRLGLLAEQPRDTDFELPSHREVEPLRQPDGLIVGIMVREQRFLAGSVRLCARCVGQGAYRLSVIVRNLTPFETASTALPEEAALYSMAATHAILEVRNGEFVSLIDPPEHLRELASTCRNVGAWPVLVGDEGEGDTMLAAPIILYDYPRVAPESPGDLFDGTEIDEILTLRIMTLSNDEKVAMAGTDPRARAILERTLALPEEQLLRLHGTIRGLRPV
jgi:hydrogenase maturation protease